MTNLLNELKERRIWRVLVAYPSVTFVLLQAIEFFMKNSGKTEHDVVVEVDRYIVWPGQALAYKIGELKIKELRAKAEKTLGDKFDIRVFHDTLLGNGALPLSVLETHMNEWLADQERAIVAEGS